MTNAMSCTVMLVSNTSWYLYNFRRGTIEALRGAGYRVVALAPRDVYSARLVDELGVEFIALPLDGKGTRLLGEGRSLLFVAWVLLRRRPWFVFNFTVKANIYSGLMCRLLRIPYANNVSGLGTAFLHDSWVLRRARAIYGLANRGARRVFLQNREDLALFRERGLLGSAPVTLLPGSGVGVERFEFVPLPDAAAPFTFVMVGRLLGDKGVREYVEAARSVRARSPQARFWLIGPAGISNRTAIPAREVAAWQEEGVVEYLGEQADVRPWLQEAHVLVLPSYREGMPRTVLEAAAMGRPAIVSDVPGCREAVLPGETGWMCAVRDAADLARAMEVCLELPADALEAVGRAARRRVESEFDERIVVEAAMACLKGEPLSPEEA